MTTMKPLSIVFGLERNIQDSKRRRWLFLYHKLKTNSVRCLSPKFRKPKSGPLLNKFPAVKIKIKSKEEFICGVGDYVHLRAGEEDGGVPFIGRIMDFWEDPKTFFKYGTVQWLYRPADIPSNISKGRKFDKNEVMYAGEHLDRIDVVSILDTFRIEFTVVLPNGDRRVHKSDLYDVADSGKPVLYHCEKFYVLNSKLTPITEELYEQIESAPMMEEDPYFKETKQATNSVAITKAGSVTSNTTKSLREGKSRSVESSASSIHSSSSVSDTDDADYDSDEAPGRRKKRTNSKTKRTGESVRRNPRPSRKQQRTTLEDVVGDEVTTNKKKKSSNIAAPLSSKLRRPKVVDEPEFALKAEKDQVTSSITNNNMDIFATTTNSALMHSQVSFIDLDEKLWDLYQEARNIIGSDDALEIIGFLKLEMLIDNQNQLSNQQICPPAYLLNKMIAFNDEPVLQKARKLLNLTSLSSSQLKASHNTKALQRSFSELERYRPGVIFGKLGQSNSPQWLFPATKTYPPIFGSVLGLDGFRTCKMSYRKQQMWVPINCEGTISIAAAQGFSRLVSPNFSYALIRTGQLQFEVAPSPEETHEQYIIKTPTGKTHSLTVPGTEKTLLRFIKVLVNHLENIPISQQRFLAADKHYLGEEQDDDRTLFQLSLKPYAKLSLVIV
jgi:hypothetical protein